MKVTGINSSDFIPPTPTSIEGIPVYPEEKYSIRRTFDNIDDIG